MSNSKPLFNPATDSSGIWYLIHRQAILAVTDAKKAEFINYMTFLSKEFPCEKCRKHIVQFIGENPFYLFMSVSYGSHPDVGMFKFSHSLHNAVNVRLGKKTLDFATAYNLYRGENVTICTSGCSDEEKTPETPKSAPAQLTTPKTTFRVTSANSRR
jgi:Erv1 / Alr family